MLEKEILQPAEFLKKKEVFFVISPTDETVLIAIHPRYQERTKLLTWWDTVKERAINIKSMQTGSDPVLQIVDIRDNSYTFVPLSLTLYNNVVKDQLPEKNEFASEEDMVKAFESTII